MAHPAPSLTGHWCLNQAQCTSQTDVLRLMGRKTWEISVIDKADEDFNLFHFKRQTQGGADLHYFEKHVLLFLDSRILKIIHAMMRLEVDRVKYHHKLVANNVEVEHADDEKHFGPCKSRTTWERDHEGHEGFTIRWFIQRGVLKVFHYLNHEGQLRVEMEMLRPDGRHAKCVKIYDRKPFSEAMQQTLDASPHKPFLLPAQ